MAKIQRIAAYEILDSRGTPALEVLVFLENNIVGTASVATDPKAAPGNITHDGDQNRYQGNGLLQAVSTIEQGINSAIQGMDSAMQQQIDKMLLEKRATNKAVFGKNVLLGVSMAVAIAEAKAQNKQLFQYLQELVKRDSPGIKMPKPMMTMIDGSVQSLVTAEMQEFFVIPASYKSFHESLELGVTMYGAMKRLLTKENASILTADKGGFSPFLNNNEDALSFLKQAAESANVRPGYDVYFGIDAKATSFYKDKHYKIKDRSMPLNPNDLQSFYNEMSKKYHILYIEDLAANDDIDGWSTIYTALNQQCLIAGHSFTATDPLRLQIALQKRTISAIVLEPLQNGTISETLAVAEMARAADLKVIVAAGLAETNSTFLADFAVAVEAEYTSFGAPIRGERVAKYNRLLEIEKIFNKQ
jgi:enolase